MSLYCASFVLCASDHGRRGRSLIERLRGPVTLSYFLFPFLSPHHSYEQLKDRDQALDWYEQLLSKAPSDVYLLNKIGDLFDAFMYLNEVSVRLCAVLESRPETFPVKTVPAKTC